MNKKQIKTVVYGLCVCWLIFIGINYVVALLYNGIGSIQDYSLDGWALFMTIVSIWIVTIHYPVKQYVMTVMNNIKKEIKTRNKKQQINKNCNNHA